MNVWAVLIAVCSGVLAGVFGILQHSLLGLSRKRLEERIEDDGRDGLRDRVGRILEDVDGHASALGLPRVFFALTALAAVLVWGLDAELGAWGRWDVALVVLVGGFCLWIVTTVLPMSFADNASDGIVVSGSVVIRGVFVMTSPVRFVEKFLHETVRRLVGAEKLDSKAQVEEEIFSALEEGERMGGLEESERDMIEAIVDLRETTAEQIMTPRTEVEAIEETDDLASVVRYIRECGHSRVPVYESGEGLDHVIGILYAKDLLGFLENGGSPFRIREVSRDALFVPETKPVRELLRELTEKKIHLAMVADEYGGTAGLVTLEDIVEEIFGEIQDEYEPDDELPPGVQLEGETAIADARIDIDDLNDGLEGVGIEVPESDEYETLGGFVVTALGRIPTDGEAFEHEGVKLTVLEASATRVDRVMLEKLEPASGDEGDRGDANGSEDGLDGYAEGADRAIHSPNGDAGGSSDDDAGMAKGA